MKKTQKQEKDRPTKEAAVGSVLETISTETKDAVEAMNRVTSSRVKDKTYTMPIFHYVRCDG